LQGVRSKAMFTGMLWSGQSDKLADAAETEGVLSTPTRGLIHATLIIDPN
jgi:hypothetical protein